MQMKPALLLSACIAACVYSPLTVQAETSTAPAATTAPLDAQAYEFVTLTFHDVRDDVAKQGDRDLYAISTHNFAQFLQWIKEHGWQPIRLEDVWRARQHKTALPEKAVLITIDDGALSSYSHIFPLLKLHQVPAVFAIPTSWINGNTKDAYEAYGEGNLMNWPQMREMQQSGLVEFASHSDDLHHGIIANPQLNQQPAAITREYFPAQQRYESDRAYATRVVKDLRQSKQILDRELGINTRAIFWPYGAVTKETEALAREAGLPMSFSLGSVLTLADADTTYQRALITENPSPEEVFGEIKDFLMNSRAPHKQRKSLLRINLADLAGSNITASEAHLSQLLNQVNAFQSNTLVLNAVADQNADGKIDVAYFPNRSLPVAQDLLNRVVWQARTRIANRVYAEMPLSLETQQGYDLAELTADLVKNNSSIEGLMIETGDALHCAVFQAEWSASCQAQLQQVLSIKNRTKSQGKYYANISNNYQTALKLEIQNQPLDGLKKLLQQLPDHADFLYLAVDPLASPQAIKHLHQALNQLNEREKQHLMINLQINPDSTAAEWRHYQQMYQQLRRQGIQKIGIDNYQPTHGQAVHQHLYRALSLNASPLSYRDPYVLEQGEPQ